MQFGSSRVVTLVGINTEHVLIVLPGGQCRWSFGILTKSESDPSHFSNLPVFGFFVN